MRDLRSPQQKKKLTTTTDDHSECRKMSEADDTSESKGKIFTSVNHAMCKFHWQNTLSIDIQHVVLHSSYSKEPIELTRELTQELTQFYSKELQVPCGYHSGFLLVDNKKHDLEDIQVKNYMFEIDLYIKDDVIDKNHKSESINPERNLKHHNSKMERHENRALGTPTPVTELHETEAVTSKPISVTPTSLIKMEQSPEQHGAPRLNSSLDESRSVSNTERSIYKSDTEVLSIVPSSSCLVDDVLGSKLEVTDKTAKHAVATVSKKSPNCSFSVPAVHEAVHSREVTPQPSRSADSTSISSCQSLLKDQNFENQLPFCRSLSSSLCQDIPLPLSFSSVSHTSSVDSVLLATQSLDQTGTPLQNHQTSNASCSEKPQFNEFSLEERASSSVSLPARFSPSLQFRDFPAGQSMPSTITGGSCNSPFDANQQPVSENHNPEIKFGGSQPALRCPLITGRSRTLRHSTPTISHTAEMHESGNPIVTRTYPPAKNLHQTVEVNDVLASTQQPKIDYIDSNQHLAGQLELLRGMNESLLAELIFLRQQHHNYTTASQSTPSPTPGTAQDSKDNLVSHLKEEKQTLQDEVQKLKEELRQYRNLAAYSQNTPLRHSETTAVCPSQDNVNIYHSEELVLRRRIADLQHQVSQLQESNLSLSAQLVGAKTRISQLETDNHKLNEQLQNEENDVSLKKSAKKVSQPSEEEDNVKNRTNIGDVHVQTDTDSRSESVGGSSGKEKRKKTSEHSRRQSSKEHETLNKTEREENIISTASISQNSHPTLKELHFENKVHPTPKKSEKSIAENKSIIEAQNDASRKQTTSDNSNKPQTEMKLVNNSALSNINEFLSSRKTRWDQYNQVRLNKASIQNLQKSLDEQDMLRQAFLAQYKPKVCDPSRNSTESWTSYSRSNSKDRTGTKLVKSTIIPSTTSDSTSLLLAAPSLPQVYSTDQDFPSEDYSDTGTDVLLRAVSLDRNKPSSPERKDEGWNHRRRMSIDSVGSSTLTHSDFEMSGSSSNLTTMKKRSQSAEFRGQTLSDHSIEKPTTREALKTVNGTRYMDSSSSAWDIDKAKKMPYVSSNKKIISGSEASKRQWIFTHGMQPYIPRSSDDMHIGDVVKFSKQSGKISQGIVTFIGPLYGRRDIYIGIELQKDEGKHDGVFEGRRYFWCKPNKGVFVTFNKIVMAWEPVYQSSC